MSNKNKIYFIILYIIMLYHVSTYFYIETIK